MGKERKDVVDVLIDRVDDLGKNILEIREIILEMNKRKKAVREFKQLNGMTIPFAKANGLHTDEDVLKKLKKSR